MTSNKKQPPQDSQFEERLNHISSSSSTSICKSKDSIQKDKILKMGSNNPPRINSNLLITETKDLIKKKKF